MSWNLGRAARWGSRALAVFTGLTLLMASGQPAMAAEKKPAVDEASIQRVLEDSAQIADKVVEPKSAEAVAARELAEATHRSGKVTLHLPDGATADVSKAQVYRVDDGGTLVRVPITDMTAGSVVGYVFDANRQLTQTIEIHLIEHTATTGQIRIWLDGRQVLDRKITENDTKAAANAMATVAMKQKPGSTEAQPLGFSFGKFNSCLSSAGVSSWVVASIGIACGAICAGTAGAGCIPCLTAAGGVSAGTIWFCIGKATR
ncbi:hypothetical protein [Archangium sp. Cb G35]|uniref:hypothetical protein n=1 Tax=Archangium sp. Cb G35 TaxID=1920190 RepID=UPI001161222A|nr:hypothetical protein [Archangium sp. Cb G35]